MMEISIFHFFSPFNFFHTIFSIALEILSFTVKYLISSRDFFTYPKL
jgi:hypothetical protein